MSFEHDGLETAGLSQEQLSLFEDENFNMFSFPAVGIPDDEVPDQLANPELFLPEVVPVGDDREEGSHSTDSRVVNSIKFFHVSLNDIPK